MELMFVRQSQLAATCFGWLWLTADLLKLVWCIATAQQCKQRVSRHAQLL